MAIARLLVIFALTGCAGADRSPVGLAAHLLGPSFAWDSVRSADLTTYVTRGTGAPVADSLHGQARAAIAHALRVLGETEIPAHVRVFYVSSREEMGRAVGVSATGLADEPSATVVLVANAQWSPFTRHEIMHVVSLRLWQQPGHELGAVAEGNEIWRRGGWLREGLAAYGEDRCGTYTNRQVAAAQLEGGGLIPVGDLRERFYELPDLAAYVQAGSLVQFLHEHFGREAFRTLWGSLSLTDSIGLSPGELHSRWVAWLRASPGPLPDLSTLAVRGCG